MIPPWGSKNKILMTLNEYISNLQQLLSDNPELGNLPVIYAADDEGNNYQKVHYTPSTAFVDDINSYYLEMLDKDECEEEGMKPNAVCIN